MSHQTTQQQPSSASIDSERFRPFSEFMAELGAQCGYPDDWRTSAPPMTEDDAIAIESEFVRMYKKEKNSAHVLDVARKEEKQCL